MKIEKVNEMPRHTIKNCRLNVLLAMKPGEILCFTPEAGDVSAFSLASAFSKARTLRQEVKNIMVTKRGKQVFLHRPEEKL